MFGEFIKDIISARTVIVANLVRNYARIRASKVRVANLVRNYAHNSDLKSQSCELSSQLCPKSCELSSQLCHF